MKFTYCIAVFASVAVPLTFAQGGMAELKSITGDEPYNGIGNAPAPIPQPMGFWGRPRYSPVGYQGMQGMQGYAPSGNWLYGGSPMDRFTSFGHSPYAADRGLHPFDMLASLLSSTFDDDDDRVNSRFSPNRMMMQSSNSFSSPRSSQPHPSPSSAFSSSSSSLSDIFAEQRQPPVPRHSPSPSSSAGSSALNLGGFYTGKGN